MIPGRLPLVALGLLLAAGPLSAQITVFPIANGPQYENNPAISGTVVVWQDNRNGEFDIYGYDLATQQEFPICTAPGVQCFPAISGSIVVWEDQRNGEADIYGWNLATGQPLTLCTAAGPQCRPEISGDTVVWVYNQHTVQAYDLGTETLSTLANPGTTCANLDVCGDIVVWEQFDSDTMYDIVGYDLAADQPLTLCTHPEYQYDPCVSGDLVVWQDRRQWIGQMDIYGYDLIGQSEFPIDASLIVTINPEMDGSTVIWVAEKEVVVHDLVAGTSQSTVGANSPQYPALDGQYIVWTTWNSEENNFDVYGARIPEPATGLLLAAGTLLLWQRRSPRRSA